jgi:hypothetical protein
MVDVVDEGGQHNPANCVGVGRDSVGVIVQQGFHSLVIFLFAGQQCEKAAC